MNKPISIKELTKQIKSSKEDNTETIEEGNKKNELNTIEKDIINVKPQEQLIRSELDLDANNSNSITNELTDNETNNNKKSTKVNLKQSSDKLLKELEEINNLDYYDLKESVYIDTDIHDVFISLKSSTKLKIGKFISYQLELFIRQHTEEISHIITKQKNKFLK